MKVIILLLLLGVVVTRPLTPLTSLPPAYDDMLFNQLGGHSDLQTLVTPAYISKEFLRIATLEEVAQELSERFPSIKQESVVLIHKAFSTIHDDMIENHFIQAAPNTSSQRSGSALFQLLVVKEKIRIISITLSTGSYQQNYNHLLYVSKFGFAPSTSTVLVGPVSDKIQKVHDVYVFKRVFTVLQKLRGSQMGDLMVKGALGQTTFTGVLDAIQAVASAWQSIASAFKTVNRETFKGIIKGEGFSKFKQSSIFSRNLGIDLKRWTQFKPIYKVSVGLDSPAAASREAETFLTLAEFMPDNVWQFNDHSFDKNGQGSTNTMVAFTKADMDVQKAHILTVVTSGTYKLAPDVYVYEKYKSVAGGIYQSTKEVRKNVPRNLSIQDIKAINAMAMLNAISVMTEYFKIDFKLPSDDPMKLV